MTHGKYFHGPEANSPMTLREPAHEGVLSEMGSQDLYYTMTPSS